MRITLFAGILSFCICTASGQNKQTVNPNDPNKIIHYVGQLYDFKFFTIKDTIQIIVKQFFKNDVFCYTKGIPYALIIGTVTNNNNYPREISVLAICDQNIYNVGDKLKISQSNDPRIGSSSLHPIIFTHDTIINKKRYLYLIGSESPAVWGNVTR
ncbi:hypothetical protein [uncultured Mucilaginibacter sp.]|uniref:hypothetical protein n=1 Tax=uncultured Mucilaginibacter sp. TaxID=797541 RepID=UPI0025CC2209|nr:hypothetical protein [uncultured Mucilaginibacter sp.]